MLRLTFLAVTSLQLVGLAAGQPEPRLISATSTQRGTSTGFSPFKTKPGLPTLLPAAVSTDDNGDSDMQAKHGGSGFFPGFPGFPGFPDLSPGGSWCNTCGPNTCGRGQTCRKKDNDRSCNGKCTSNGNGGSNPWPPSRPDYGGSSCNSCSNTGCPFGQRCVNNGNDYSCRGRCQRQGGGFPNNPNNPYACDYDYQCNNGETCDRGYCRRDYWGNRPEIPTGTKSCYARNCWDCLEQYGCLWDPNTLSGSCKPKEQCDYTYQVARGSPSAYSSTPVTACVKSQSQCGSRPPPGAILDHNNDRGFGCTNHGQCGRGQYCYSCNKCRGNCAQCSPQVSGICGPINNCYVDRDSIDGRCPSHYG